MNKRIFKIFVFTFLCGGIFSQDIAIPDTITLIEEVKILAPRSLNESGAKIMKMDSLIIENKLNSDLSALLSENSSVFIKSKGKGSLTTASFRGTNASHTKVLWNNIPLNSPLLGMVDMSLIPTNIADEISLYYGGASLIKTAGALGGVVDLKTRPYNWDRNLRAKIISSYGSYSSFGNAAEIGIGNEKIQSVSKAYLFSSDNNFEFVNNDIINGSIQKQNNADYEQKGFLQEMYYRPGTKSLAGLKLWYQKTDRGIPALTTNESNFNNRTSRQNDENLIMSAEYSYFNNNYKIDLNSGTNIQTTDYEHKNYINGVGLYKTVNSLSKANSFYNKINYNRKIKRLFEFDVGAGYNFHKINSHELVRNEGYDTTRQEILLFISAYTDIIKNTKLGMLARKEIYDNDFAGIIPSVFAEYHFNNNLIFRSSLARNIKYPNMNDLYFSPGGNPDLKHEKGLQFESGFELNHLSKYINIKSCISGFYSKVHDWILWRPTVMGFWQPENISLVEAKGIEFNLMLNYKLSNIKITTSGNYAYTSSVNKSAPINSNDNSVGKQLPYIPLHSANLFIRAEYNDFYFSYQWNYYSERFTGSAAEPGLLVSIYPYYMNDISLGKKIKINGISCNLGFFVYNIFNESYRSVLWHPMPGRNYTVRIVLEVG